MGLLNVGVLCCGPNPVLLRERLGVGVGISLSTVQCRAKDEVESVSASLTGFDVAFLICLMCRNHSASFWISLRGDCSVCSCTFGVSE